MSSLRHNRRASIPSFRAPLSEYNNLLITGQDKTQNKLDNIENVDQLNNNDDEKSQANREYKITNHIQRYGLKYSTIQKKQQQNVQKSNNNKIKMQYQILLEKMRKIQAEIKSLYQKNQELRQQNKKLVQLNSRQNQIIEGFSDQAKLNQIKNKDLVGKLSARKKSSEDTIKQLRQQIYQVTIKNQKMIEIVQYLENKIENQEYEQNIRQCSQQGLKKRVDQLIQENNSIRNKMAKIEVQCEKYKLKTLEGEQYWSGKLESLKSKNQEILYDQKKQLQDQNKNQLCNLEGEVARLNRVLNIKQKTIICLQQRITKLLI